MLRILHGLRNSHATKQQHLDQTLQDVKNTSAYVDDILLHAVLLEITSVTFRPVLNSQTQQHKYSFTQMQFWEKEV